MVCENCGEQINAESKYCPFCGAEQDGILKCHKEHYTSSEVMSLSWYEYNKLMADELNENGYECYVDKLNEGKFVVYKPDFGHPTYPLVDMLSRKNQIDFLARKGLINNGRCPRCGREIKYHDAGKYMYTDGTYSNVTYHICKDCYREGMHLSINPAQQKGCIVALLLLPYYMMVSWLNIH